MWACRNIFAFLSLDVRKEFSQETWFTSRSALRYLREGASSREEFSQSENNSRACWKIKNPSWLYGVRGERKHYQLYIYEKPDWSSPYFQILSDVEFDLWLVKLSRTASMHARGKCEKFSSLLPMLKRKLVWFNELPKGNLYVSLTLIIEIRERKTYFLNEE